LKELIENNIDYNEENEQLAVKKFMKDMIQQDKE
jgi:hypothetical protein